MEKPIQSVELADLVFKAMNQRDLTDVEPFIHEDIIFDFPGIGRVEGSKRVLIFLKALLRKYRILTFTWEKNYRIILRVPFYNNHKMHRYKMLTGLIICFLTGIVCNTSCTKPDNTDHTTDVLFIGASYFLAYDLPGLFEEFATIMEHEVFIDECIESGLVLYDHANSLTTELKILEKDWDFVILQGVGTVTAYPDSFPRKVIEALEILQKKIYLNCIKTKIVFCMPWAFEDGMTWKEGWTDTYADMQEKIYDNTLIYSDEVGFVISPVGWAWYQVLEEKNYPLHYLHLSDWNHPSLRGSYLMACTVYSTIFQESTTGISIYGGLPVEEATYFQEVASDVVLNSPGVWNLPAMIK